jgi:TolB-like protein
MAKSPSRTTVAVLPLRNIGTDKDIDFLCLALPDEIATTLSHVRSLSIQPFATTSKYISPDIDLQKAGREMHVDDIVAGHCETPTGKWSSALFDGLRPALCGTAEGSRT